MLYALALTASTAAKGGNTDHRDDGLKYATKVVEIVNSGQTPARIDPNVWQGQKSKIAGEMQQAIGLFLHTKADYDGAIEHLKTASELNPKDPLAVYLTAESLKLGKYAKLQAEYNKLTDEQKVGDQGKELLKQVDEIVDQMIEVYAKAVALAEADSQLQQLGTVAKQTLEGFYKYRHNNTTDGMDDLIKKYKSA
jgi:tetratricopeptide (TPR) repeat protein